MINNNQIQIKDLFNNPENEHVLFIYEVINFDNNNQALILENTNNTIVLKLIQEIRGAYISTALSPQVKVIDEITNSVGLKISTDYVFITNADMNFLEQTRKTYFFTINKILNNDVDVYFLGENSIKSFSSMEDEDLKLDQQNLINLWSISLQNFNKINISKNSKTRFVLQEQEKQPEIINSIEYNINKYSLIQTIEVKGNLYNKVSKELISNVILDLKINNNCRFLPLMINYVNLHNDSTIQILNFDLGFQTPFLVLEKIITFNINKPANKDLIKEIFLIYTDDATAELLKKLFFKIVAISWAFNTNFNVYFDKSNDDFIKYYNATYANIAPIDYVNNIIKEFVSKYSSITNSVSWKIFKSLCLMNSDNVISPFSWGGGGGQIYKDTLWYFGELELTGANLASNGFNNNGSLNNADILYTMNINSNFFDIKYENNMIRINNKLIDLNKINSLNSVNQIVNYVYLPDKITEINTNIQISEWNESNEHLKYLTYLIFDNENSLTAFLKKLSEKTGDETKLITIPKTFLKDDLTQAEFIERTKPLESTLVSVVNFEKNKVKYITEWDVCGVDKWNPVSGGCHKYTELDTGPDANNKRWCRRTSYGTEYNQGRKCDINRVVASYDFERPAKTYSEGYEYSAEYTVKLKTYSTINNIMNKSDLNNLLNKFYKRESTTLLSLSLADSWKSQNWEIVNVQEDTFYSIYETADKTIAKTNTSNVELFRNTSFQSLDNTITKTRTIY